MRNTRSIRDGGDVPWNRAKYGNRRRSLRNRHASPITDVRIYARAAAAREDVLSMRRPLPLNNKVGPWGSWSPFLLCPYGYWANIVQPSLCRALYGERRLVLQVWYWKPQAR